MQRHRSTLDHLLGSQTRARLVRALVSEPERSRSVGELIRIARCSGGFARTEIAELERQGLIRLERSGNRKLLHVDVRCPLYLGLRLVVEAADAMDDGSEPPRKWWRMPYEYRGDEFYPCKVRGERKRRPGERRSESL